jgi:hypothetical protein
MAYDGSYPAPPGNKPVSIVDVTGPSSYTQISLSSGAAPSGGQAVSARHFGLTALERVEASRSDDGMYQVIPYLTPFNKNGTSPGLVLQWVVASTGAQVASSVNLSGRTVRLYAQGAY